MDSNTHSTRPPQPLEQLVPPLHRERLAHPEPPEWLEVAEQEPPQPLEQLEPPQPLEPPARRELAAHPEPPGCLELVELEPPGRLGRLGWLEPPELPEGLAELAAVVDQLAAQPLDRLSGPAGSSGPGGCGGWWIAWRASGSKNSPRLMPWGRPPPTPRPRPPPPPAGCADGCAWAPAQPTTPSGPPGPCSGARWSVLPRPSPTV